MNCKIRVSQILSSRLASARKRKKMVVSENMRGPKKKPYSPKAVTPKTAAKPVQNEDRPSCSSL